MARNHVLAPVGALVVLLYGAGAAAADPAAALPRLGIRGTAQLYGGNVPLAFALFRRPIASLRQWAGF